MAGPVLVKALILDPDNDTTLTSLARLGQKINDEVIYIERIIHTD